MAKTKYYAVWRGRKTGIFTTWEECSKHVTGFSDPGHKSFDTLALAQEALNKGLESQNTQELIDENLPTLKEVKVVGSPIEESICVDAAWNTQNGLVEYQGVNMKSGKLLFHLGPLEDGTNNIVEFLAIVHALRYCKSNNSILPIYSDSITAISWVKNKKANTKHPQSESNKQLFGMIYCAEKWLNENTIPNKILKWETSSWGEIPADLGENKSLD